MADDVTWSTCKGGNIDHAWKQFKPLGGEGRPVALCSPQLRQSPHASWKQRRCAKCEALIKKVRETQHGPHQ